MCCHVWRGIGQGNLDVMRRKVMNTLAKLILEILIESEC
jgi:hypothetical protein